MADGTFLITITGRLEYLDILASAGSDWHCKYEIISGPDWKIIGGIEAGITQTANVTTNGDKVVFNFPIDVTFKSTNIYGCKYFVRPEILIQLKGPQIILSIYRGLQLEGYGRAHLPLTPGVHKLAVPISKPVASSLLGYLGSFFGYQPELLDARMLATTAGNHLLRMVNGGEMFIDVSLISQGFQSMGYDVGHRKD